MLKQMRVKMSMWTLLFLRTLLLFTILAQVMNVSMASDTNEFVSVMESKAVKNSVNARNLQADSLRVRRLFDNEREGALKVDSGEDSEVNDGKDGRQNSKPKDDGKDTADGGEGFLQQFQKSRKVNLGFVHSFIASLSVIIVSELGDKTFFLAAILAMRHSRLTVLAGALSALFVMTIMAAFVGYATTIIPRVYTHYASIVLFSFFGIKMLKEGWSMSADEGQEEYEEAQAEIKKKEDELLRQNTPVSDLEIGIIRTPGRRWYYGILSTVFLETFTLTFLAEWGDRSQIATIILGAGEDVFGVIFGGLIGHALCTALAVIGGRFIAQKISVRTVTIIGGVVFLVFAASGLFFGPKS